MKYKLFSNCFPVKGAAKSIVVDIQRNDYKNIPNSLYNILVENPVLDFDMLNSKYGDENIVDEYKSFLLENEMIFECPENELDNFPPISTSFFKPYVLTNAIIEISKLIEHKIKEIKESFDEFGIQDCFLMFYEDDKALLSKIMEEFSDSRLISVQILYPFRNKVNFKSIKTKYQRITKLIFFNSPYEKTLEGLPSIVHTKRNISSFKHCGQIRNYFVANIDSFLESLNHNSCLHKKISIDRYGNIKNCPAMSESYGNIQNIPLNEGYMKEGFRKYWNLTKDEIEVCKDCEFRYICTDCRAFTERTHFNKNNIDKSKPLKCGYDPYKSQWEDWSINPLKKKAIEYYGLKEIER